MAGKHSAGRHTGARKSKKVLWIALAALLVIVAVAVLLVSGGRPGPEEIPGDEAMLREPQGDVSEQKAPEEEPAEEMPAPPQREDNAFGEEKAPEEEPANLPTGPAANEIPGVLEEETESPDRVFGPDGFQAVYDGAGIEPVYQLAGRKDGDHSVYVQGDRTMGVSQYEYIHKNDMVLAMAETHYFFLPGGDEASLEMSAQALLEDSMPSVDTDSVTVTCEVMEGGVMLKICVDGLDDPQTVAELADAGVIPYADGEHLSYGRTVELLHGVGFAKK